MIILGPEDADLNGAPSYYRTGNWRPRTSTSTEQKDSGSIPSIPFDWCEKVLEYDVRFGGKPNDSAQPTAWTFQSGGGGSTGDWTVEDTPARALRFNVGSGNASYWEKDETLTAHPDRVAAYAVFMVDSFGTSSNVEAGFELRVLGSENSTTLRGARGVWTQDFNYVKVGTTGVTDVATTVPIDEVTAVWHRVAFDAPVVGGDKSVNALDDQINYDSKSFFGSVTGATATRIVARFGKTVSGGTNDALQGRLRNFVASAPGRFVRAWFRTFASSTTMTLRLVLVADAFLPTGTDNRARFRVRHASRATGSDPFAIPNPSPLTGDVIFTTANTVQILTLSLTGLTVNEPFWFTVERVFGAVSPETQGTVHLLQALLTPAS